MVLEQIDPPQGRNTFGELNTFGRFSVPWIQPPQGLDVDNEFFAEDMLFLNFEDMLFLDDEDMLFLGSSQDIPEIQTHALEDITTHDGELITVHGVPA